MKQVKGCWDGCEHLRNGIECGHPDMPDDERHVAECQGDGDEATVLGPDYFRPGECPLHGTGRLVGDLPGELVRLRIEKACREVGGSPAAVVLGVKAWHHFDEEDAVHNGVAVPVLVDPWAHDANVVRALPYPGDAVAIYNRERGLK